MSVLFDPQRHEALAGGAWRESEARRCIGDIASAAMRAYTNEHFFHPHPLDDFLAGESIGVSPYFGAMGVLWGIAHFSAAGAIDDMHAWVRPRLDVMIERSTGPSVGEGSLLFGPLPALVLRARLAPPTRDGVARRAADLDQVHTGLERASSGPVQELMLGIPGGALLAEQLLRETHELRWQALLSAQLDTIWAAAAERGGVGWMWDEELFGERSGYLGAIHGFAGQALPLVRAFTLLSADRQRFLREAVPRTLAATALRDGALVNWPSVVPEAGSPPADCLVQYCHGAPGIVASFAGVAADVLPGMDGLMLGAGELIWRAGPLKKGSNLCHGTAGNGLALLKQFARTADAMWLDRARSFAMHAIAQYHEARRRYGQDRFSLWTGDIGLAVFLNECIEGRAAAPLVDTL